MRHEENGPLGPLLLLVGVSLAAALVLGGVAVAAYQLTGKGTQNQTPAATSPAQRPSTPKAEPRAENTDAWRAAVRRFGVAFTTTEGGHRAWLNRLEPLVSPDLAQGYSYTDLDLVPTERLLKVTGGAAAPGENPARTARLHYTNGLIVEVTVALALKTQKWIITTAVPGDDAQDPAAPPTAEEATNA